jgi:hypothetical protein
MKISIFGFILCILIFNMAMVSSCSIKWYLISVGNINKSKLYHPHSLVMILAFNLLVLQFCSYGELIHFITLLIVSKISTSKVLVQSIVMSLCTKFEDHWVIKKMCFHYLSWIFVFTLLSSFKSITKHWWYMSFHLRHIGHNSLV